MISTVGAMESTPATSASLPVIDAAAQLRGELMSFVRKRLQNKTDAEDLVQEIFVRMLRSVSGLKSNEKFHAWVYQIARNAIADYWSARQRARLHEPEDPSLPAPDTSARDAEQELSECLRIFSARLPGPYKDAIELSELAGLPHREIAVRLGISVSGVKSRVQRGREKLKSLVLECCAVDLRGGEVRACEARESHRDSAPCGCGKV
jgi:RNA polymerase sigma-70 factor (ECF subfamily)